MRRIVVLGGGISGLTAALTAKKTSKNSEVTVIDGSQFHVYKPFLNDLLVGRSKIKNLAIPFSGILESRKIRFVNKNVISIAAQERHVRVEGEKIPYDNLIISLGGAPSFNGVKGVKTNCLFFRDLVDVARIKDHVIRVASKARNAKDKDDLLTFTIIGGGVGGVELACFLSSFVKRTLRKYRVNDKPRILIIDSGNTLLKSFHKKARIKALERLSKIGVQPVLGYKVMEVRDGEVLLNGKKVRSETIIWCAGVKPNPVISESGIRTENGGVLVNGFLQSVSHPEIFAVGDSCFFVSNNFDKSFSKHLYNARKQAVLAAKNLRAYNSDKRMQGFNPSRVWDAARLGYNYSIFYYKNLVLTGKLLSKIHRRILKLGLRV